MPYAVTAEPTTSKIYLCFAATNDIYFSFLRACFLMHLLLCIHVGCFVWCQKVSEWVGKPEKHAFKLHFLKILYIYLFTAISMKNCTQLCLQMMIYLFVYLACLMQLCFFFSCSLCTTVITATKITIDVGITLLSHWHW